MKRFSLFAIIPALACAAALASSTAHAKVPGVGASLVIDGQAASPPVGFLQFCRTYPQQCGLEDGRRSRAHTEAKLWSAVFSQADGVWAEPGSVVDDSLGVLFEDMRAPMAPSRMLETLERVNLEVNLRLRSVEDRRAFGVSDHWALPLLDGGRRGDCEDFVLEKRRLLIAEGVPAEALSIAIVHTPRDVVHSVLLVNADGDIIALDNLSDYLRSASVMPYQMITWQAFGSNPFDWRAPKQIMAPERRRERSRFAWWRGRRSD